mmetsp:Transcript_811/g.1759  ORF Transcript_811/g.1759 Transcript_811/m.1759 type:complete len:205 (-) Transcript_811:457-1071(-)
MRPLVSTTYKLEGDRLEILLAFEQIEALRAMGHSLGEDGSMKNADSVLRCILNVEVGMEVKKYFPGFGICDGKVSDIDDPNKGGEGIISTLEPGIKVVVAYQVTYTADKSTEDLEEAEVRKLLVISDRQSRIDLVDGLKQGFQYLEERLTGACQENFSCVESYITCSSLPGHLIPRRLLNSNLPRGWTNSKSSFLSLHGICSQT